MKPKKPEIYIGIDPGVITGCAIWNSKSKQFEHIFSCGLFCVMDKVGIYPTFHNTLFVIENPNLRKWFGNSGREKLQGAGSIKRDYSIWVEWFEMNGYNYEEIAPKNVKTKTDQMTFKKITGWQNRTNSHSRDAAMMVFQK